MSVSYLFLIFTLNFSLFTLIPLIISRLCFLLNLISSISLFYPLFGIYDHPLLSLFLIIVLLFRYWPSGSSFFCFNLSSIHLSLYFYHIHARYLFIRNQPLSLMTFRFFQGSHRSDILCSSLEINAWLPNTDYFYWSRSIYYEKKL